jgi:hypothetical protein
VPGASELTIEEVADLWRLVFGPRHLGVDTTEHMLITAEAALTPKTHRERSCQLAFEEYYYSHTHTPPMQATTSLFGLTQWLWLWGCGHHRFGVAGYYVGVSAVLGLYAAGRTTGLVVDCGHHSTTLVPTYEGRRTTLRVSSSAFASLHFATLRYSLTNIAHIRLRLVSCDRKAALRRDRHHQEAH